MAKVTSRLSFDVVCVCDENSLGRSKQVRLFVLKPDPIWVVRVGLAAAAVAGS